MRRFLKCPTLGRASCASRSQSLPSLLGSKAIEVMILLLGWVVFGGAMMTEGATPRLIFIRAHPDQSLEIRWESRSNGTYMVEAAEGKLGSFEPITMGLPATGTVSKYLELSRGGTARFYRVRELSNDSVSYSRLVTSLTPSALLDIDLWFRGLSDLGLRSNVVWQASLRSNLNGIGGGSVPALIGAPAFITGTPEISLSGMLFHGSDWLEFANPLISADSLISACSVLVDFAAEGEGARTLVSSSRLGAEGPSLIAGGSRMQGPGLDDLFFDLTTNGVTPLPNPGVSGRRSFNRGNTSFQQFSMAGWNLSEISLRTDIDRVYSSPYSYPRVWNGNPMWRVGAELDGSSAFLGRVSFVTIMNRVPFAGEYQAMRSLYYRTLGKGLTRPVNAIFEGDSLTEDGVETSWGMHLMTASHWLGKANKRNVARGGENTLQMSLEFDDQVLPFASQPGRNYLFIWGGANDLAFSLSTTILGRLRDYWKRAREVGFKVVAFTLTPRTQESPAWTAKRLAVNDMILGAAKDYDYLIDVSAIPSLMDPLNAEFFLPDGLHLRSAGYRLIADRINEVISNP